MSGVVTAVEMKGVGGGGVELEATLHLWSGVTDRTGLASAISGEDGGVSGELVAECLTTSALALGRAGGKASASQSSRSVLWPIVLSRSVRKSCSRACRLCVTASNQCRSAIMARFQSTIFR